MWAALISLLTLNMGLFKTSLLSNSSKDCGSVFKSTFLNHIMGIYFKLWSQSKPGTYYFNYCCRCLWLRGKKNHFLLKDFLILLYDQTVSIALFLVEPFWMVIWQYVLKTFKRHILTSPGFQYIMIPTWVGCFLADKHLFTYLSVL